MFIESVLRPLTFLDFATACLQEPPRYQGPECCTAKTLVPEGRVSYPSPFIQVLVLFISSKLYMYLSDMH
jgi:hypothetical protein